MRRTRSPFAHLAVGSALALTLAACGSNDADTGLDTSEGNVETEAAEPLAQIDELTGESTSVTLDAGFVEGLTALGLTPAPLGDATISAEGVASFPITGGTVTYYEPGTEDPFVQGSIEHEGSGLSLTNGETTVELTDFTVDPGASVLTGDVTANGEEVVQDAELFFLDGSTLQPLQTEGTQAILEGTTVSLTADAADLLNQTYGTDALTEFFTVGVARIVIDTEPSSGSGTGTSAEPSTGATAGTEGTTETEGAEETEGATETEGASETEGATPEATATS